MQLMDTTEQTENSLWTSIQNRIAENKSAAVVLVDETSSEIAISNNNSICKFLYSSEEFAPRCAEFCGRAFQTAFEAGKPVHVKCHANLNFLTVPLRIKDKKLAAIVGRTFLKIEDYQKAAQRASQGDWQQFPIEEFFANVLISRSTRDLENAVKPLERLNGEEKSALESFLNGRADERIVKHNQAFEVDQEKVSDSTKSKASSAEVTKKNSEEIEEFAAWRVVFESLLNLNYTRACAAILDFLSEHYSLVNLAWLEPRENHWEKLFGIGDLETRQMKIEMPSADERLFEALNTGTALELRERAEGNAAELQTLRMFPFTVGGKMRGAVIIGDEIKDKTVEKHITRFLRNIAPELEILRLRQELEHQARLSKAVQKFNESLKQIDAEDFWVLIAQASAELMEAERSSLLAFDETTQKFYVKAAIGSRADFIKAENFDLGEKISHWVLNGERPLAVENIETTRFVPAPPEWHYRTKSFISYPIKIGERRVGVFNAADKIDGSLYDESDIELLNAFAPQIAVALDRTMLQKRAGEFEQLSITDTLTGLLNRRYLEERLAEEISRSHRNGYPVSFMMIDVDDFKSYNDAFTHPEGDKALRIVGQLMKETLRSADVAARYGGEEFSILLPQTTLSEAFTIAERIREKVERHDFPNRRVTVSIGIAVLSPKLSTPQALISAADKALYKAKQLGRNNVQIYDDFAVKD